MNAGLTYNPRMNALLIGKVLLLGSLIVGCTVLTITYVRSRRAGVRPWRNPTASPYLDMYGGGLPPIPPPPQTAQERCSDGEPPTQGSDGGSSPSGH
jgi:hypothetical protein